MRSIDELNINPELQKLSPQKSEKDYRSLEASILSNGKVNKAIEYAEDGDIVDGMYRAQILIDHTSKGIEYRTVSRGVMTTADKTRYILRVNDYTHHQRKMAHYRLLQDSVEDRTLKESVEMVASELATKQEDLAGWHKRLTKSWEFGELVGKCVDEISDYITSGGGITPVELNELSNLDEDTQRKAYRLRIESEKYIAWKKCRQLATEIEPDLVVSSLIKNVERCKLTAFHLSRYCDYMKDRREDSKPVGSPDLIRIVDEFGRNMKMELAKLNELQSRGGE